MTDKRSGARSAAVPETTFAAGYGQQKYMISHALLSAGFVVFYTTEGSLIRSFYSTEHLQTYLLTAILMYLLSVVLAQISRFLDRYLPWNGDFTRRLIAQILLGVAATSLVALHIVYEFYELLIGIDLRQTDYLERDFFLMMVCIAGINVHHHFLYYRAEQKKLIQENTDLDEYNARLTEQIGRLREKLADVQATLEDIQVSIPASQQELNHLLNTTFHEIKDGRAIKAIEIAAFFLDEKQRRPFKAVHILLWDGSRYTTRDVESLTAARERCGLLFLPISRDFLINRYAIGEIDVTEYGIYRLTPRIQGAEPRSISEAVYNKLRHIVG